MRKEKRSSNKGCFSHWAFPFILTFLVIVGPLPSGAAEMPYPNRAIIHILGYPAGGPSDVGSRVVLDRMEEFLGQKIVTEYKPGAGGVISASFVAKSKPDGYTILMAATTNLITAPLLTKTSYTLDDFAFLGAWGCNAMRLHVKADSRWKTLKDFVEEARRFPGKLTIGSIGNYTVSHFTIEKLCKYANIKLTHVPYKGSAELAPAVLGGHIDAGVTLGSPGFSDSPLVRVLATASDTRLETFLDEPTFTEYGYPIQYEGMHLYALPKGTPKEIADKLSDAQRKVYERYPKEIAKALRVLYYAPMLITPEETTRKCKANYEDFVKVIAELGMKRQ